MTVYIALSGSTVRRVTVLSTERIDLFELVLNRLNDKCQRSSSSRDIPEGKIPLPFRYFRRLHHCCLHRIVRSL